MRLPPTQQSNKKLSAAQDRNNYSPVSSIDVLLEEDSKEELSDNFNANNSNVNRSFALTIFTIKEEDRQITHHVLNTTPQMHHVPITTFLCQSQLT
jgi:hypothetical protein